MLLTRADSHSENSLQTIDFSTKWQSGSVVGNIRTKLVSLPPTGCRIFSANNGIKFRAQWRLALRIATLDQFIFFRVCRFIQFSNYNVLTENSIREELADLEREMGGIGLRAQGFSHHCLF